MSLWTGRALTYWACLLHRTIVSRDTCRAFAARRDATMCDAGTSGALTERRSPTVFAEGGGHLLAGPALQRVRPADTAAGGYSRCRFGAVAPARVEGLVQTDSDVTGNRPLGTLKATEMGPVVSLVRWTIVASAFFHTRSFRDHMGVAYCWPALPPHEPDAGHPVPGPC